MASRLSSSAVSLEIELTKVGEKLVHLPSSMKEISKILAKTENILSRITLLSTSIIEPLHVIRKALIAEGLVRHSNMGVKISVACCISEIMRIMAPNTPYDDNQMKEYFELVVTVFENVSSSSDEYTKIIKVIDTLSSGEFVVMMCHLQLDGLIERLFRRILRVAESSSSDVVSNMEKIMTMIIQESKELPRELVNLLAISGKSKNEIASPVRTQLAQKVLKNYADQLNPDNPDPTLPESEKKTLAIIETPMPSKSVTTVNGKRKKQIQPVEHGENLVGSRIKVWWPEDDTYYEGTVKSFEPVKKKHKVSYDDGEKELIDLKKEKWELLEDVSPMLDCTVNSESEKETLAIVETPMASNSVTTVNGKHKKQIQSVEHGENLVGSRIKVWWPEDNTYYEGTVKSFESSKKKHEVRYDDGDKELIDLEKQTWELVEDVSPLLDCAESAEHGENLVGSKIKVWWPADKSYYEGVVESFDRSKMKHKVLYDDGDEDLLDLNKREWMLLEDVSAIEPIEPVPDPELVLPIKFLSPQPLAIKGASTKALAKKVSSTQTPPEKVSSTQAPPEKLLSPLALPKKGVSAQSLPISGSSTLTQPIKDLSAQAPPRMSIQAPRKRVSSTQSPTKKVPSTQALPKKVSTTQSGLKSVQGYKVKKSVAPILEAIIKKHGDIASDCVFKTPSVRASILEAICDVVGQIQTNDVEDTISEIEEIQCQVTAAEANKINVSWLQQHLDAIKKRTEKKEKCSLLMKGKASISLVNRAAIRDVEEKRIQLLTAQERFKKAEKCLEVLKLVEKKLHDNILEESKAASDSWITQPVL